MTLHERIKEQRKNCGMSQEKLAELLGVSRQAVTKWESGQTAPSTENLFRLAEIFGTTVDLLLQEEEKRSSPAEEIYYLYKMEEAKRMEMKKAVWKKRGLMFLATIGGYLLVYLLCRIFGMEKGIYSIIGWLIETNYQQLPYLYGWLLSSNLFWISMLISAVPTLFGKFRFAFTTLIGFAVAIPIGELFGPYPGGEAIGHTHYGWLIWGVIFLLSIIAGIIFEKLQLFCKKPIEKTDEDII